MPFEPSQVDASCGQKTLNFSSVAGSMGVQHAWENNLLACYLKALWDAQRTSSAMFTSVMVHLPHRPSGIISSLSALPKSSPWSQYKSAFLSTWDFINKDLPVAVP